MSKTIVLTANREIKENGQGCIDRLLSDLAVFPLDPVYEKFGGFYQDISDIHYVADGVPRLYHGMKYHFIGNFYKHPNPFNIYTNDTSIIASLRKAIDANRSSSEYRDILSDINSSVSRVSGVLKKSSRSVSGLSLRISGGVRHV